MIVLTTSLEEFASRRRKAQTDLEASLHPVVERGVDLGTDTHGWDEVLNKVADLYREVYLDESGESSPDGPEMGWRAQLRKTLQKSTRDERTADRITVWLATWILSQATIHAAQADEEDLWLEWVDMGDESVRPAHREVSGQQRPPGEMFDVDGVDMPYPGWTGAPIELWINCRCTLRPVLAAEAVGEESIVASQFRDVSREEREKDADAGRALPDGSFPIDNCSDLKNAIQAIGRAKDPGKAKAHIRKRKSSLGCPDVDLPDTWAAEFASVEERTKNTVVVALPKGDHPVHDIGEEQKHVTLAFLGETDADVETVAAAVEGVAGSMEPFTVTVSGTGVLGEDGAKVLFVEASDLQTARERLLDNEAINGPVSMADSHPHFVPHMTLTYGDLDADIDLRGEELVFDRLALWHGEDQTEYALGGVMAENTEREMPPAEDVEDPCENRDPETGDCLDEKEETPSDEVPFASGLIPWHGVMAPEGKRSGDGRKFALNSLRSRPLPLPLTWQEKSDDGHKGNVTVARIDRLVRVDGEIRATGFMRATEEADKVVGLLAEFGRFGVSVDADEAVMEMSENEEEVVFTDGRIASACIVAIPAFSQAWVSLGEPPEGFLDGEDVSTVGASDTVEEELVAAAAPASEVFVDVAPGRTEDGPGWLTHPVDTDRLRDYWVRGPGAAKIAWGTPGDFNRCRVNVAEYVKPQHLNGYCANRHYDALGFWPGQGPHAGETVEMAAARLGLTETEAAEAMYLTAASGPLAPAGWFTDPKFEVGDERLVLQKDGNYACPVTVTEEGEVYGHVAAWGTCHTGFANTCVTPPQSPSNYAHFLLGQVATDNGVIPCGSLTIGGGHAGPRLTPQQAMAHYDSTSTAWADVSCGQDEFGIWVHGWVRPGVPDEMVVAARASKLSGDWREIGGSLEMIAALSVNVPGFPITRVAAAMHNDRQVSLVAAGIIDREEVHPSVEMDTDQIERFADAVAAAIEARATRRAKMAALAARMNGEQ